MLNLSRTQVYAGCTQTVHPGRSYGEGTALCLRRMDTHWQVCAGRTLQHGQQSHGAGHQTHHAWKKELSVLRQQ